MTLAQSCHRLGKQAPRKCCLYLFPFGQNPSAQWLTKNSEVPVMPKDFSALLHTSAEQVMGILLRTELLSQIPRGPDQHGVPHANFNIAEMKLQGVARSLDIPGFLQTQGPQQFFRMSMFYLTEPEKKGPICHPRLKKKINGLLGTWQSNFKV